MNTFFKTFTICLIIALSFLFYKFFGKDGYSDEINKVNNSMYSIQKEETEPKYIEQKPAVQTNKNPIEENKPANENKNLHTCYFYSNQGKLTPIVREFRGDDPVKSAILLLLKGPLISEVKKGIYTEVPSNVDLIDVTYDNKKIIVNLTSNFGNGGGFDSIENRIKQLSATVKNVAPNKQIYLYINGKEVEYLGGDGVYVKQPLD